MKEIAATLPAFASVKEAIGIYREDTKHSASQIRAWLDILGFE